MWVQIPVQPLVTVPLGKLYYGCKLEKILPYGDKVQPLTTPDIKLCDQTLMIGLTKSDSWPPTSASWDSWVCYVRLASILINPVSHSDWLIPSWTTC